MSRKSYKAWYAKNKEKRLAYNREYCAKNRDRVRAQRKAAYAKNPKIDLTRNKRWRDRNPEYMKQYLKKYHAEHRQEHNAACREWRKRNPEKVLAQKVRAYRRKSRLEKLGWLKDRQYVPVVRGVDKVLAEMGVRYE